MGTSSLKAGMHIQLEKLDYFPGESLGGTIYVSLNEDLEAASLYLSFKGREKALWTESHGQGAHCVSDSRVIANFELEIYRWPDGLNSGSFLIPFTFKLPEEMPGSISRKKSGYKAIIRYEMVIKIVDNKKKECHYKHDLTIKEVNFDFRENVTESIDAGMVTCCCIAKGNCFIKASILKNSYYLNEAIHSSIELNNMSGQLLATRIEVAVIRSITLHVGSRKRNFSKTLGKVVGSAVGSDKEPIALELDLHLNEFANKFEGIAYCHGEKVQCHYLLRARAVMNGCCMCCGKKPNVKIPIYIFLNSISPPPLPPPPQGWNPDSMDIIALEYSENFDIKERINSNEDPFFNQQD